jgi:ferredoxin
MRFYFRCSLVFLIQVIGSAVVLSQCFCNCFQFATTISSRHNRNCVGHEKNDDARARAQSLSSLSLPRPPTTETTTPRIKTTHICSSLSSYNEDSSSTSSNSNSSTPSSSTENEYSITVHYENRSCDILVRSDETILTALERNQLSLENLGLPNSMIPSDCRRGNCLTCTGTHASVSSRLASGTAVVCDGDGLSPHMSRTIQEKGYILTCSSRVIGEGLQLNLGENHKVWKDIYQDRLKEEPTQSAKWAAMARSRRRSDERNKARWEKHTEELLQQAERQEDNSDEDGDEDNESP